MTSTLRFRIPEPDLEGRVGQGNSNEMAVSMSKCPA